MSLGTVIVTRPAHQAELICEQLRQAGFTPLAIPVLHIEALTRTTQPCWTDYQLIHFSSPNAILCSLGQLPAAQKKIRAGSYVCVMGPGSQQALEQQIDTSALTIFSPQQAGPQRLDSETLIKVLEQQNMNWHGLAALLVKGRGGRSLMAQWLTAQGAHITTWPVYKRVAVSWNDQIEQALSQALTAPACLTLLTSSEAVWAWAQLIQHQPDYAAALRARPLVVTHSRVAQAAQQAGFTSVHRSIPSDQAVLAKLKSLAVSSLG